MTLTGYIWTVGCSVKVWQQGLIPSRESQWSQFLKGSVENYPQHPQKRFKVLWGCDGAQIKWNNLNSSCSNFARIWTESNKHLLSFWNGLIFGKQLPHPRSTSHFCQEVKFSQKLTISAFCTEMLSSSRIIKEHYSIPNTGFILSPEPFTNKTDKGWNSFRH